MARLVTKFKYLKPDQEKPIGGYATYIATRAIEDNAHEILNQRTYADYIGTRPGAERFGSHHPFCDPLFRYDRICNPALLLRDVSTVKNCS